MLSCVLGVEGRPAAGVSLPLLRGVWVRAAVVQLCSVASHASPDFTYPSSTLLKEKQKVNNTGGIPSEIRLRSYLTSLLSIPCSESLR